LRPEEEKEVVVPKFPTERDLERHLEDVEKGVPKEKEKPKKEQPRKDEAKKEETKEKKPIDNQLERALEFLKSWEIFKNVAKEKQN
jgi:coenzyme F420-reducing hydrogenase alpha subunit